MEFFEICGAIVSVEGEIRRIMECLYRRNISTLQDYYESKSNDMIYTAISEEQVQLIDALIETLGDSFRFHSTSLEKYISSLEESDLSKNNESQLEEDNNSSDESNNIPFFETFSNPIVHSFVKFGEVTEIYGLSGTGKTTFCISVIRNYWQIKNDGEVLFIDFLNGLMIERIIQILLLSKGLPVEEALNKIILKILCTEEDSIEYIHSLHRMLVQDSKIKLIILDGLFFKLLTSVPQNQYQKRQFLTDALNSMMRVAKQRQIAVRNGLLERLKGRNIVFFVGFLKVIFTNNISFQKQKYPSSLPVLFPPSEQAFAFNHLVNNKLFLKKDSSSKTGVILPVKLSSSNGDEFIAKEIRYQIKEEGIVFDDISMEEGKDQEDNQQALTQQEQSQKLYGDSYAENGNQGGKYWNISDEYLIGSGLSQQGKKEGGEEEEEENREIDGLRDGELEGEREIEIEGEREQVQYEQQEYVQGEQQLSSQFKGERFYEGRENCLFEPLQTPEERILTQEDRVIQTQEEKIIQTQEERVIQTQYQEPVRENYELEEQQEYYKEIQRVQQEDYQRQKEKEEEYYQSKKKKISQLEEEEEVDKDKEIGEECQGEGKELEGQQRYENIEGLEQYCREGQNEEGYEEERERQNEQENIEGDKVDEEGRNEVEVEAENLEINNDGDEIKDDLVQEREEEEQEGQEREEQEDGLDEELEEEKENREDEYEYVYNKEDLNDGDEVEEEFENEEGDRDGGEDEEREEDENEEEEENEEDEEEDDEKDEDDEEQEQECEEVEEDVDEVQQED